MLYRLAAVALALAALNVPAHADDKAPDKAPPKIVFTTPIVITGHPTDVSAPIIPGNKKPTVVCNAKHQCSVVLN